MKAGQIVSPVRAVVFLSSGADKPERLGFP